MNCFRKSDIDAQRKFTLKVMERAEVTFYRCNSLLVHVLKCFRILAGRCGSVVVLRKRLGYERSGFDPGLRFSVFLIETLTITVS